MADRTSEHTLLLKAKDLAGGAVGSLTSGLDSVVEGAGRVKGALEGLGRAGAVGLGMAAETLLQGGSLVDAGAQLGIHMASELTETFGEQLITRFTESSLLAAVTAPLTAIGTAMGGFISAAIPIGMALLPVILVGAIVAAIVYLVNNPDVVAKIADFVGGLIGNIMSFLGELPGKLLTFFGGVWDTVSGSVGPFVDDVVGFILDIPKRLVELGGSIVKTIIDGLVSLPGKIADVIADAFRSLKIDIGPFHITSAGVSIDLPQFTTDDHVNYHLTGQVPHKAKGGWVGMHGPELVMTGEEGPEYITPNSGGLGGPITVVLNVAGETIAKVIAPLVSESMYYDLAAEAPSSSRA